MNRFNLLIMALVMVLSFCGCTSYKTPITSTPAVNLSLTTSDIEIENSANASGTAFTILPQIWNLLLFSNHNFTKERAIEKAIFKMQQKGFSEGADFIIEPKVKTFYVNLFLFDYAKTNVIGKAVKIKKKP